MNSLEPGTVVEFYDQRALLLGQCVEVRGKQIRLLTETGRDARISASRVLASYGLIPPSTPRADVLIRLKSSSRRRTELLQGLDLGEVWELLAEEGAPVRPELVAELLLDDPEDPDMVAGVARALRQDRIRFRAVGSSFRPLPPEEVERNLARAHRKAEENRVREEAAGWLDRAWAGAAEPPPDPALVPLLQELVLGNLTEGDLRRVKELLATSQVPAQGGPFELLVRLGVWDRDVNLTALRLEAPGAFSPAVLARAEELARLESPPLDRRDLRDLPTITIDGEWTRDYDDALSAEDADHGFRLYVHITDVAGRIPMGGLVDLEARARGLTIYTPDAILPMLPDVLSREACSLIAGESRTAITLEVRLDQEGRPLEPRLYASLIRVDRRLSYGEADRGIETGDPVLARLDGIGRLLRERRREEGALIQSRPDLEIKVQPDRSIWSALHPAHSAAQVLVSEAMILTNGKVGELLAGSGIPALFRGQPPPTEPLQCMENFDPMLHYRQRRMLPRAGVTTAPSPHAGLGLSAYVNVTSPVRRYGDLALQRQIHALLTGEEPPYGEEELEQLWLELGSLAGRSAQIERDRNRYWLLKHLEADRGRELEAIVLERQPYRTMIYLPELALEADVPRPKEDGPTAGQKVRVRLEQADPRAGRLRLAFIPD